MISGGLRGKKVKGYSLPLLLIIIFCIQLMVSSEALLYTNGFALKCGAESLVSRPWTVLTYGLVHASISHFTTTILLLSFLLYFFNFPTGENVWGQFLFGTFVGGILFLLLTPKSVSEGSSIVGASAGVCALVPQAIISLVKDDKIFSTKYLLLIPILGVLILDIYMFQRSNWGIFAHLGGYIAGGLWLMIGYANHRRHSNTTDDSQDRVRQELIEKANNSGYASLTEDERQLLSYKNGHNRK